MNWLDDLKPEELPPHYQEMVSIIGLEATMKLAEHFSKQPFYFTGLDELVRKKKEDYIRKNFTGSNHNALARATGYGRRWVYAILSATPDDRQADLFIGKNF
ncbi:MAG: hypothetical protein C4560_03035 [Nitrospiraceae bacterium]|nr:MAG: hypothetical protein C4560_03035 [Nitrospiraceae bacterium]